MSHIVKSTAAEQDLINIWLYSYQEWGEAQADLYLDGIDMALRLLVASPYICRERDEFTPPVRIHSHNQHLIIYITINSGIHIIRVLHKNMDIDGQLENELS